MAEPRPGFATGATIGTLARIERLIAYRDHLLTVGKTAGAVRKTFWSTGVQVFTEDGVTDPLWESADSIRGVEARGNLYLTTIDALRKVERDDDASASPVGLIPPSINLVATSATAGSAVEDGNTVAYQAVLQRTDLNGVIVTSAPSGRALYTNSSGSDKAVDVTYSARDGLAGDVIKIYRTEGVSTGAPGNDLALVNVVTLTGAAPSLQTVVDTTEDNDRGEVLYTSDSADNGGAARANQKPPAARELALYQQSLFYVSFAAPAIIVLRYTEIVDSITPTAGIGQHVRTGTRTNGSTQITGISSATNLQVGMLLFNPGSSWSGTAPVRITSIVGTTLTMSATWTGATDGAPAFLGLVDAIKIGTEYHPSYSAAVLIQSVNLGTPNTIARTSASTTVFAFGTGDDYDGTQGARSVALQALSAQATFTISGTHGDYYDPPIPLISAGVPQTISFEDVLNGYRWSKADEPDHALLLTRRIGNSTAILRALVARDAIWMLKGKGDGIYRTSGFGELSGWRDDIFEASTYLLHAELACVMADVVYAWTNKGPCAISDAGVTPLGDPIANLTRDMEMEFNHYTGQNWACFAVPNDKDHEVLFGLPVALIDSANSTHVGRVFAYNTRSNTWSQWFVDANQHACGAYDRANKLQLGTDDDGKLRTERGIATVRTADADHAITISAVNTSTGDVTISAASGWTPVVGDLVLRSGHYSPVIGVTDATHFAIDDANGFTTGAGTAYEAFTSRLSWLPRKQGGAHVKRFTQVVTHWDDTQGLLDWSVLLAGDLNPDTIVTQQYARPLYERDVQRRHDTRALVPRGVALNTQLYPSVVIRQADARWRIGGLTSYFDPATDRVSR